MDLLICPVHTGSLEPLTRRCPTALLPVLGKPLVQHWIEWLAAQGSRQIAILAPDRPEEIRGFVEDGARWGVRLDVIPALEEPPVEEAVQQYGARAAHRLEGLPGNPDLLRDFEALFSGLIAELPRAKTPDRVGIRSPAPGVWLGRRTRLAAGVQCLPPCWIGADVLVEKDAVIGPNAVIEDRVVVGPATEVAESWILPETLVGEAMEMRHSVAWGSQLTNWKSGSTVTVPDAFMLAPLGRRPRMVLPPPLVGRFAALLLFAGMSPFALFCMLKARLRGENHLVRREALRPGSCIPAGRQETLPYWELPVELGWLRRWPQLWNIVRGEFCWVGNRPLAPAEVHQLRTEFDRLWLSAPLGLISLGDLYGATQPGQDDARAHASFYAARGNWKLDASILFRALWGLNMLGTPAPDAEALPVALKPDVVKPGS